jgi:WD40 repeat protein
MPDEPPRLFLSYGVRDAWDIAERLHRDLTARGYKIWQDIDRIRTGWPWDNQLEDGLLTSEVVLALLSPHAVRRALDTGNVSQLDSVCLDEIAYARFKCKIPIVPVKVRPCEAPFLIYRLQHIDFRRWNESERVYQAGLDRIYEAIEAVRRGEKRERTWGWLPKPWDFEPFLQDKRKDFVGREWLFEEVNKWRVRGAEPALLITGEPGIGKSAIVAALVHENTGGQVFAYHCCQADTPATLDPAGFVRNLAAMLSGRLDDYAAMLEDPTIVKVLEDADKDPASAFEAAILAPLHQLPEPTGTGRYLLIDALDEALARRNGQTIVDLLSSRINRLPSWLRIAATTRNEQDVLNQLRGLTARELDAQDEQNLSDLRRFIAGRLTAGTLQSAVFADGRSKEELSEKLLTASSGNFLYATMALKAVERGQVDFRTIELLPPALSGMYKEFFDRLYVKAGLEFRQARDVLEIVVAAREPLQRAEIARATGLDEEYDLPPVLDSLAPFLPVRELRYSLFHKSLSDWLTGKNAKTDRNEAGAYYVSLIKGRTRLADWCWADWQHGITKDRLYCLRHLPAHLAEAGRDGDLRPLLLDFNWLQTKLEGSDVNALIADYGYLQYDRDLQLVESALRLSAHVLARDSRQLGGQLMARLLDNPTPDIRALLHQAAEKKPWPWLRPLKPSLTAPGGPLIRTLEGHTDSVSAVAVTPDGRRALSASEDRTLRLWDLGTGQTIRALEGHTDFVSGVAVTPDGRRALSASGDRTLRLWDLGTGQTIRTLEGHTGFVSAVAVTPDGRRALSASGDRTLRLWDLGTGQTIRTFEGHTGFVLAVAVSPDGRLAVSAASLPDRALRVWDLDSGQTLRMLEGHTGFVSAVAATPDGRRALSASGDRTLRLWDLGTGQTIRTLEGHSVMVYAVAVSPDGRRAVSGSHDRTLRLWDLETGQTICILEGHTDSVSAVAVTPDSRRALSASGDRTLRLWDLGTGQTIRALEGHTDFVSAVAVSPDGRRALSASADGTLRLWDLGTGQTIRSLEGHTGFVSAMAVGPDSRRALSASGDTTLRLWDLETGQTIHTLEGHADLVWALAVTPEGRRALSASADATLRLWDLGTGQTIRSLEGHKDSVSALAVTPDGHRLVSGSHDRTVRLWNLETGQTIYTLEGHAYPVTAVVVMPDGRRAISASADTTLRLWDLGTGQMIHPLEGHTDFVSAVAVTPDGRCVISASGDKTLRLWDLGTGQTLCVLRGHTDALRATAVTPDGRRAVSGSDDGSLRLWDLESGKEEAVFTGEDAIGNCAVAPDGRTIIAVDESSRVHFLQIVEADETKPLIDERSTT